MLFRVYFDMIFAPNQEVLIRGTTIEEAVQRFLRQYQNAFITKIEFERELEEGD